MSLEKSEFAPARKQSACSAVESFTRPAERRTTDFGIRMRAVAIMRSVSVNGTSSLSPIGVPGTFARMLTGTDSGCGVSVASVRRSSMRSSVVSPSPMIPPVQTVTFVVRTASIVRRRSSYVRVVTTLS